eukprot:4130138-Pleurochrysis_carterae.AAC.1
MSQDCSAKKAGSQSTEQKQPGNRTPGMARIGINGFGRIGRLTFRYAWEMEGIEIVAVNEIVGGAETAAYLAQFDSVHGTWSSWYQLLSVSLSRHTNSSECAIPVFTCALRLCFQTSAATILCNVIHRKCESTSATAFTVDGKE